MANGVHGWDLEWYLTLCESSHVGEAADELRIGQSTLSRRLSRLERDVGAALFDRVGTRLRLNPRGAALRDHLARAGAEVAEGVAEVRRLADPESGTIRFDFLHSLSTWLMPSLVRGFLEARPGIEFSLHQGPGIELSERVAAGESDLAIATPPPEDPELEFLLVLDERQGLAVPAGHRLAGRSSVDLAEAADESFATLLRGYGTRITFDALCAEAGFVPRIVFEAGEILTAGGLVSAGLAVAVVPLDNAELHPAGAELIPLRTSIRREIGLVRHRRAAPNPPVDDFWDFVAAEAPRLLGAGTTASGAHLQWGHVRREEVREAKPDRAGNGVRTHGAYRHQQDL
ncbi:LysR family transcriptional regulator [Dietzia sp.]|uniref:LysR family transcriptional regulator n=1 Tax=Dietzia sp. TaxID=1871616 RepID=UPI002FD9A8D7